MKIWAHNGGKEQLQIFPKQKRQNFKNSEFMNKFYFYCTHKQLILLLFVLIILLFSGKMKFVFSCRAIEYQRVSLEYFIQRY